MTLDEVLDRLEALTSAAQKRWESEQLDEDADFEPDEDEQLWLTLECDRRHAGGVFRWRCGFRVRQDEATVWAMHEFGPTKLAAAQALLTKLIT